MPGHEDQHSEHNPPSADDRFVIDTRLKDIERQRSEDKKEQREYERKQLSFNGRLVLFTGLLFLTSAVSDLLLLFQTSITKESADAAKSAAQAASDQVKLMRQQFEAQEAAMQVDFSIERVADTPELIRPIGIITDLTNIGPTPGSDVRVNASVDLKETQGQQSVRRHLLTIDFSVPTINSNRPPLNGIQRPIRESFKFVLSRDERKALDAGKIVIGAQGTVSYKTAFGKSKIEPVCWVYWTYALIKTPSDRIYGPLSESKSCSDFDTERPTLPMLIDQAQREAKQQK